MERGLLEVAEQQGLWRNEENRTQQLVLTEDDRVCAGGQVMNEGRMSHSCYRFHSSSIERGLEVAEQQDRSLAVTEIYDSPTEVVPVQSPSRSHCMPKHASRLCHNSNGLHRSSPERALDHSMSGQKDLTNLWTIMIQNSVSVLIVDCNARACDMPFPKRESSDAVTVASSCIHPRCPCPRAAQRPLPAISWLHSARVGCEPIKVRYRHNYLTVSKLISFRLSSAHTSHLDTLVRFNLQLSVVQSFGFVHRQSVLGHAACFEGIRASCLVSRKLVAHESVEGLGFQQTEAIGHSRAASNQTTRRIYQRCHCKPIPVV